MEENKKKNQGKSDLLFERLTPVDNVNLNVYEEAINYVFDNQDIKNVAISGAYSAGKSSILATYKKKHPDVKFLHISLTHFASPNEKNTNKGDSETKENVLEGKILNQLIHQISSDKIPQTNFRVKKTITKRNIIGQTVIAVAFLISVLFFVCFDSFKNYVISLPDSCIKSIMSLWTSPYSLIIGAIIVCALLCIIVYGFIKMQRNKNVFRKLNLQGNEIEIFEESNESYFDKYLNEVLYLFENANADVIVFEDMDRFNVNQIFERLREVNTLVNIQLQKEEKPQLRFFYLLRDDIFTSKDRIKFFDYIIPVVPVIDSSNSYDQFISLFQHGGLFEKFDKSFLQGLSLYIDDMRLLKNIYNEFVIYYNTLNTTELDCNKMLAIIAYKNLFPYDFSDLQLNRGFVYTLFHKKDDFIKSQIDEIKASIEEKEQVIADSENEHLQSIDELNAAFAYKYLSNYTWQSLKSVQLQSFVSRRLSGQYLTEYNARKKGIDILLNDKKSKLENDISNLKQKLLLEKNQSLSQIINRDNIDKIFSITSKNEIGDVTDFSEIKSSDYFDLLKYLIRNGYIDETYADYMTYFYENSLSRIDKIFLRSVADKKAKEYTYRLKDPEMVISRLKLSDFEQEEILNFDLFAYLLRTPLHVNFLEKFIDQLKESENFHFVGDFFNITTERPVYVKYLNTRWPEAFATALKEKALTEKQIRQYSICSIYYCNDDLLVKVNQDNSLSNYISASRDYLAIEDPDIDKLIHSFNILGVRFAGFDYDQLNKELFNRVYENSFYVINSENLILMQKKVLGIENEEDIYHKNYTLLHYRPDSPITRYVDQNIDVYFDAVFKMCNEIIYDDESVVISVLNNASLSAEHKQTYISYLNTRISLLKEISVCSLWSNLLNADCVQYSVLNIIDAFNTLTLSVDVIAYINRCHTNLDFSTLDYDEKVKQEFFDAVVTCNQIENQQYNQIVTSLGFAYDDYIFSNISNDKVIILIDAKIIKMTSSNLVFIRENYPDQILCFIRKNIEEYVAIMSKALFSEDELLEILKWDIDDDLKIRLLQYSNNEISVIANSYSSAVCLYILEHNFKESELLKLVSLFDQLDDTIQTKIFDYSVSRITELIDNPDSIPENLLIKLFNAERLDKDYKMDLLSAVMPKLDNDRIKNILSLLGLKDFIKLYDHRSRPKIEINEENNTLLAAFKEKGIIFDYGPKPNKAEYRIIRSKSLEKSQ